MRMTDDDFDRCMAVLIAGVGKPMPADQVDVWREFFADMTFDDLKRGIVLCLRDYKYAGFPPVGLIRQAAGVSGGVLDGDSAAVLAWDRVVSAMREHGAYRSIQWDDPAIPLAIGSWADICLVEREELHNFVRRRFIDAYKAHKSAASSGDGVSRGLIAADAGRLGFTNPEPVRIGAEPEAVYGFIGEQRLKALPGPLAEWANMADELPPEIPRVTEVRVGEDETPEEFERRKTEDVRRMLVKFAPAESFAE